MLFDLYLRVRSYHCGAAYVFVYQLASNRDWQEGRTSFTMPDTGTWLLNVIWTKALPRSEETDFETVFSSLSFGVPPHDTKVQ